MQKISACFYDRCRPDHIQLFRAVHSSAISGNLETLGIPRIVTTVALVAIMVLLIIGGVHRLCKVTEKLIPFIGILYAVLALIVVFANISHIGEVLSMIFKGAFTGTAALGGFAGAAFKQTFRWGLARGVFSTDAGLCTTAPLHAQAEAIDHPAQQGMWAVFEVFVDTFIVCTLSGFLVLFSGIWTVSGQTAEVMAGNAMSTVLGSVGSIGCLVAIVLFSLSSLMGIGESIKVGCLQLTTNRAVRIGLECLVVLMVVAGCLTQIQSMFFFTDAISAIVITVNMITMVLLGKKLHSLTKEWFDGNGTAIRRNNVKS